MTTTIPTTSFVNVDAIVPPELRAQCVPLVEKLEAFLPQFRELITEAIDLWVRIDELELPVILELDHLGPANARIDTSELVSALTGGRLLYDALDAFGGFENVAAAIGRNGNGKPEEVSK